MATIEEALDTIRGPRETYRPMLEADAIIRRICRNAEGHALRRDVDPWVIIGNWTGHGSGVSNAIYQVYRTETPKAQASNPRPWESGPFVVAFNSECCASFLARDWEHVCAILKTESDYDVNEYPFDDDDWKNDSNDNPWMLSKEIDECVWLTIIKVTDN